MFTPAADGARIASEPGVVERAVAEVLDEVLVLDERRHADPLRALAAHLRDAGDVALALAVEQDHRVAADAGADERAVGAGVELLCGQPLQKNGVRDIGSGARHVRATPSRCSRDARVEVLVARRAAGCATRGRWRSRRRAARPRGAAASARPRRACRRSAGRRACRRAGRLICSSRNGSFSSTTTISSRPAANSRTVSRSSGQGMRTCSRRMPRRSSAASSRPSRSQRAAQLAVGAAGGHDAEPGVAARAADLVEPVGARRTRARPAGARAAASARASASRGRAASRWARARTGGR